jgi:hypothetical protein
LWLAAGKDRHPFLLLPISYSAFPMDMPMSADLLTMREYKREVIKADKERRALAGHLALSAGFNSQHPQKHDAPADTQRGAFDRVHARLRCFV